jgi:pimeloyl-ACP methyl ester carboxylesterase
LPARQVAQPENEVNSGSFNNLLKSMKTHSPIFKSAKAEARFYSVYDTAMKHWPIPYKELDIQTGYGSTHVITAGPEDAPPLMLFHCALMTSAIWSPIIEDLARNHRIYAVDVIGDVGKTIPSNPPATEKDLAIWVVEIYKYFRIKRAKLLGWSFGGFVATNFTIHEPERVEKLALLAPYMTFVKGGPGFLLGFLPLLFPARFIVRIFEKALCYKSDFGNVHHSQILYERFRSGKMIMKVPPRVFTDDELQKIDMPVLLLIGEQEFLYNSIRAIDRARKQLIDCDAELVKECNHAVVSDQTLITSNRILDFLDNEKP